MPPQLDKQNLELLMSYTTFHIGVYISLAAAVIGAEAVKNIGHWSLRFSVPCFAIAGITGGIIASSVAEYSLYPQTQEFANQLLGFWGGHWFRYRTWAIIEHTAFWLGALVPAFVFIFRGAKPFQGAK